MESLSQTAGHFGHSLAMLVDHQNSEDMEICPKKMGGGNPEFFHPVLGFSVINSPAHWGIFFMEPPVMLRCIQRSMSCAFPAEKTSRQMLETARGVIQFWDIPPVIQEFGSWESFIGLVFA